MLLTNFKAFIKIEKYFIKNASFLFGSKFYVAALSILLTPLIARLFSPSDYGIFGLYNTLVQNLVIIGTLTFPLAITTAKLKDVPKLVKLLFTIIISFTLLFSVLLFFTQSWLNQIFSTNFFSQYWYLILIGFMLSAALAALKAINIRLQRFKVNASINILEGSSAKLFNVSSGYWGFTGIGLLLSDIISKSISVLTLLKKHPKSISFSLLDPTELLASIKQFKAMPLFVMPSHWIGMLNNQFIIIAIALLFSKEELGLLVMAVGLFNIPLHLLSNTFQPIITERLASLKGNIEGFVFFKQAFLLLLIISSTVFVTLILIPTSVYTWLLGDKWQSIGTIINVIALSYIFLHLDQAFENGFLILEKQKVFLYFSLLEIVAQFGILVIASQLQLSLLTILIITALIRSLVSSGRVMYLWKKLKSTHN